MLNAVITVVTGFILSIGAFTIGIFHAQSHVPQEIPHTTSTNIAVGTSSATTSDTHYNPPVASTTTPQTTTSTKSLGNTSAQNRVATETKDVTPSTSSKSLASKISPEIASRMTIYNPPPFPNDANLSSLLASLQNSNHGSAIRPFRNDNACTTETNANPAGNQGDMTAAPGVFFNIWTSQFPESDTDGYGGATAIEVHAYDSKGGHIGIASTTLDSSYYPLALPQESSSIWHAMNAEGSPQTFILQQLDDARLVIKGKTYGTLELQLRGEGNECAVTPTIDILMTPFTTVTIPIKQTGDMGPIHYDWNNHGAGDFDISLNYQISENQKDLLTQIYCRLYQLDMGGQCRWSYTPGSL